MRKMQKVVPCFETVEPRLMLSAGAYAEGVSGDLGNGISLATPITLSSSGTEVITGKISTTTDKDAVKFTALASGTMTVYMKAVSSPSLTGRIAVYDVNTNLLNIANTSTGGSTSFTTSVTAGSTYYLVISGRGATGFYETDITSPSSATAVPAAPTGLAATAATQSQINLAWAPESSTQSGFHVYRSTDSNTFSLLATVTGASATSYSATGLTAGTKCYFKVMAFNSAGESGASAMANATTSTAAVQVPAAPTGLTATAASTTQVNLAWAPLASTQTGFNVYKSTDGTNFSTLASVSTAIATSYAATGLTAGTQYWFKVTAINTGGESAASSVANATTLAAILATPTGLTATGVYAESASGDLGNSLSLAKTITFASNGTEVITGAISTNSDLDYAKFVAPVTGQMTVTMNAVNSPKLDTVLDIYSANGTRLAHQDIQNVGIAETATVSVTAGTTYYVEMSGCAVTTGSYETDISIASPTMTMAAVTAGLTATAASQMQVNLAWAAESSTQTGFHVYSSTDGNIFSLLASVTSPSATSYSATGLTAGTKYYFKVMAFNSAGESGASATVNATTSAAAVQVPAVPTGLTATAASTTQVNLAWAPLASTQTGFNVYKSTDGTNFSKLASVSTAIATSYAATGLTVGTQYWFKVTAINTGGESAASSVANATTQAAVVQTGTYVEGSTDFGNTIAAATPVQLTTAGSAVIQGAISTVSDLDYVKFVAPVTGQMTVTMNAVNSPALDNVLDIYNASGALIVHQDIKNVGVAETTTVSVTAGSTYYVEMSGCAVTTGNYETDISTVVVQAPVAPTDVMATAASQTQINVGWAPLTSTQTGFHVYKSTDGVNYALLTAVNTASAASYSAAGLTAGTQCWFKVKAFNTAGESGSSNAASATTQGAVVAPPPTGTATSILPADITAASAAGTKLPAHTTYISLDGSGYGVNAPNGPDADPSDPTVNTWAQGVAKYGSDLAFVNHLGYKALRVVYNVAPSTLKAGDCDIFTAQTFSGTYAFEADNLTGTAANPITIMAQPGSVVTVTGTSRGMGFQYDSYVNVAGFTVAGNGSSGDGFDVYYSNNMTFKYINESGYGLGFRGMQDLHNLDISFSVFADNAPSHGVYIGARDLPNSDIFFHDNILYGNQNQAFQQNGRCNNLEFYNNIVHSNINAGVSLLEGNTNAVIKNNLIFNNGTEGLIFYDYDDTNTGGIFAYNQTGNVVSGNIIWQGQNDMSGGTGASGQANIMIVDTSAAGVKIGVTITNNILVTYNGPAVSISAGPTTATIVGLTTITGNTMYSPNGSGYDLSINGTKYSFASMQSYQSSFTGNLFANPNFFDVLTSYWSSPDKFNFAHS